MDQRTKQNRQR